MSKKAYWKYLMTEKWQNNHKNSISDHRSQITVADMNITEKLEMLWELPVWRRGMKWENTIEKTVPIDSPNLGLLQTFHL